MICENVKTITALIDEEIATARSVGPVGAATVLVLLDLKRKIKLMECK